MSDLMDPAAEATVLTAALAQSALAGMIVDLDAGVFTSPIHRLIHEAFVGSFRAKDPRDYATIARRATQRAATAHQGAEVSRVVMDMIGKGHDYHVGFFLDRLKNLHTARTVQATAHRLIQMTEESVRLDEPSIIEAGIAAVRSDLDGIGSSAEITADDLPMSLDELLAKKFEHDWLIPDLLERTDRLILTGYEGTGKSYLVAQLAMTIAAGLHPFLGVPMSEHNQVLVIDAENSERQTGRRYTMMKARITELCRLHSQEVPDWSRMVRFVIRPEGIALNDPRTVKNIERQIAATRPRFVAMGPLYRLHRLDTKDEQAAKELTDAIDRLRVKYQFSVVCEAHVAHGQAGTQRLLRPTGSSLFLRWPEFGMGLRPTEMSKGMQHPSQVDLSTWRGGREERMWPRTLQHGSAEHHLPWNNGDPDYYQTAREKGYL